METILGGIFPRACAWALLAVGATLLLGGCSEAEESAASDDGTPQRGGTMVLGLDQEPAILNTRLAAGGMAVGSMINEAMFEGFIGVDAAGNWYPIMATEVPTAENGRVTTSSAGKMTVKMGIRPDAHWSDNTPISCDDFAFTWKTTMDEKIVVGSRIGWDKIESVSCPSPRQIVVVFSEPYAPYLSHVMAGAPLPKHELEGKNFNSYWNNEITVVNGPFRFKYWKRNVELVVERNPNYWRKGPKNLPYMDAIKYRFLKDTNTLKIQLRTGEVDYITPPPDTNLPDELAEFPRSDFKVSPGVFWEHLAFQQGKAPLDNVDVRKAISYSVDRKQITDVVLRKQVTPLQSSLLPWLKEQYVPAWEIYSFDPDKVAEHMEKAGYTREGQWWVKDGKPITVLFKSTAGNALRMKVSQLLQQQLKRNGIRMNIRLEDPPVFFGQSTIQGSYDIGQWAMSSSLEPGQTTLFACDQVPTKKNNFEGNNNYRYCNEQVTKLLKQSDRTVEQAERAKIVQEIQRLMAEDAPILPLYQRPETVAYSRRLHGLDFSPIAGQFWNIREWWVEE